MQHLQTALWLILLVIKLILQEQ